MKNDKLADGVIRPLTKADTALFRDHLFRLDAESRRNRFLGVVNDDYLARYPDRCCMNGASTVAYVENGIIRGVAELHPNDPDSGDRAEVAFSVDPGFRQRGIGSELFRRILAAARRQGIRQLRMNCHPQNEGMRALARKFHTDITIDRSGTLGRLSTSSAAEEISALSAA